MLEWTMSGSGGIMNAVHQISLKLQMGIHPAAEVRPEILRAMWWELLSERFNTARTDSVQNKGNHTRTMHSASQRAG